MITYSCDRCRRKIELDEELRYSVWIEIEVALDSSEFEYEDPREHLDELNEIFERLSDEEKAEISEQAYQKKRFDLCAVCHGEYVKNPLGIRWEASEVTYSDN
ncbi:MAG: hypothetical protein AAF623_08620 [Planctomycetota bacterium]